MLDKNMFFRKMLIAIKIMISLSCILSNHTVLLYASMAPTGFEENDGLLREAVATVDDATINPTENVVDRLGAGVPVVEESVGSFSGAAEAADPLLYNAFFPINQATEEKNKRLENTVIQAYMTRLDYSNKVTADDRPLTLNHINLSDRVLSAKGVAFILYHHPFIRTEKKEPVLSYCIDRLGVDNFVLYPYKDANFLNNFGVFALPDAANEAMLKVDESHSFNHRMLFENLPYAFIKNIKIVGKDRRYFYLHGRRLNETGRELVLIDTMNWLFYDQNHNECGSTIQQAVRNVFGKELLKNEDIAEWYVEFAIPMGWLPLGSKSIEVGFLEVGVSCRINTAGLSIPQLSHRHFKTFTPSDDVLFGIHGLRTTMENLNVQVKDSGNITINAETVVRNMRDANSAEFKREAAGRFCYITATTLNRIQEEARARRQAEREERWRARAAEKIEGAASALRVVDVVEGLNVSDKDAVIHFLIESCLKNENIDESESNIEKLIRKIVEEDENEMVYVVIEKLIKSAESLTNTFSNLKEVEKNAKKAGQIEKLRVFFTTIDRVASSFDVLYWRDTKLAAEVQRLLYFINYELNRFRESRTSE